MDLFLNIIVFIFGLCIGSLINCLVYRLEKKENFITGRSYCPKCRHQLGFFDLIPLLSFVFLKGRCRYCQAKISWQYPMVELLTALIFLLISNYQFLISNIIYLWIIASILIIVFIYDLKHYLIPEKLLYLGIGLILLYRIFEFRIWDLFGIWQNLKIPIFSALGAGLFFLMIYFISEGRWLGSGDVILAFFMGLFLGFPAILVALFFAFFIGAIIGLALIFLSRKKLNPLFSQKKWGIKSQVPFGPFLVSGTFIALFWSEEIINWYINLL